MTFGMFDVLDAVQGTKQKFAERWLALTQWLTPQIVAIDHQQIECTSDSKMIGGAAMQGVKIWNAPLIEPNKSITALTLMHAAASTMRG